MATQIINADCRTALKQLPAASVQSCITSPPYFGLRDYGVAGQIGLEQTPVEYVENLVAVFSEVKRVLRDDGTLWLNLGDSYAGSGKGRNADGTSAATGKQATHKGTTEGLIAKTAMPEGLKPKDLIGIPWMVAFALRADGWYLRQDIIWHKPNPMPESVKDRCTKAHEYIFLLSKSQQYFYDGAAIAEPALYAGDNRGARTDKRRGTECNSMNGNTGETRNKRSVWTVSTKPCNEAHFATYPPELIEPCILASTRRGQAVLDPFFGAGTTGVVADRLQRDCIGIELNPAYYEIAKSRISADAGLFSNIN